MKKFLFLMGLVVVLAHADSLPWHGTIVFEDPVRVDDAPGLSGHPASHPQMIMDKNFNMYAVWQDDRDTNEIYDIYFSMSSDTGKSWHPNKNLSEGLSGNFNNKFPWITVDDNGRLYVVWQGLSPGNNWKVYFCRSDDGGSSFTPPDTIKGVTIKNSTTSNINLGPQPKIAASIILDTTYLYLSWVDDATNVLQINFARSLCQGDTFSDQIILDHNPANINREPYLAVDDSGWVHCVWRWGTGGANQDPKPFIGYNKSTDRGISFMSDDIIVNDTTVQQSYRGNPVVTINNYNGSILVAFEDSRRVNDPHPDIFWARSADQGLTFSENKRVNYFEDTLSAFENRKPSISIDPQGIAVVAWHDNNTPSGNFGIHLAAYNDSVGSFGQAVSLFDTYTESNAGAFGANLYPPSLYVTMIDSVTNFFLVWQDLSDDPDGNIYSIRGRVVEALADLDVDNDSLDVHSGIIDLKTQPAGPAYSPYAKAKFILVNTDAQYNPDSLDGPSEEDIDSISYTAILYGPKTKLDSVFIIGLPNALSVGQSAICTLAVVIPEDAPAGTYTGDVIIQGVGVVSGVPVQESFTVSVEGPSPRASLDSLRVTPIPFKPNRDPTHDKIHFQGLTSGARVRVYDLAGSLVWSDTEDGDGHCAWDAKVASGIYIYLVTSPDGEVKKGKLSVIR